MKDLLAITRTLNLYYHFLHNVAHGEAFGSDHKMTGAFYEELDTEFDSVSERHIGLSGDVSSATLLYTISEAASILSTMPDTEDMLSYFKYALDLEKQLRAEVDLAMQDATEGTKNLLAGIADRSEVRDYKLKQRVR